ncbi:MAG: hypothetical protein VB118_11945 [Oscillospiraceae bacterium]|nr:hypothetical protein [Oscillospiraceae bacterium]
MKKQIISVIFTIMLIFVFGAPIISDAIDIDCLEGSLCPDCNYKFTADEISVINDGTTDDTYYTFAAYCPTCDKLIY